MSPGSFIRLCTSDRFRWSTTSRYQARPSFHPGTPAKPKWTSSPRFAASQAALPTLHRLIIAPPAASRPLAQPSTAPKYP